MTLRQRNKTPRLRSRNNPQARHQFELQMERLESRAMLTGNLDFAFNVGNTGLDESYGIATDVIGNVYITGYFQGTVDFDPGPGISPISNTVPSSPDFENVFVAKYDASGEFAWARTVTGGNHLGIDIAVDLAGNVYTTGRFQSYGGSDFDPGPGTFTLSAPDDGQAFVWKLDTNGNFVWASQLGANNSGRHGVQGNGIAVDTTGNVYATGSYWNTADFDPGPGTFNLSSEGRSDNYIVKLNSNGSLVWAKSVGGSSDEDIRDVGVDASGNVYAIGSFSLTADFDPGPGIFNLTGSSGRTAFDDIFVLKLESDGNFIWAHGFGSSNAISRDWGAGLALDGSANVYLTGTFVDTVDFDPGAGTSELTANTGGGFVVKLDNSGNFLWASNVGGNGENDVGDVIVDNVGNVYASGSFQGTADFDPGPGILNLTSAGSYDIFTVKFDSEGNLDWARVMGGSDSDAPLGIAIDGSNNIYTTGRFRATADFDPGSGTFNLTSAGNTDLFVVKLFQTATILPSRIQGIILDDFNNDGDVDFGENGMVGVNVTLTGVDILNNSVNSSMLSLSDGSFSFDDVLPGTYSLSSDQPIGLLDGRETAGSGGGTVDNSSDNKTITGIVIGNDGIAAVDYFFGNIRPAEISGLVWEDFNVDGQVNFGEQAIDNAMVTLTGTDDRGDAVNIGSTTDTDGIFMFFNLRPGEYQLAELQPTGFVDGSEVLGTINGMPGGTIFGNDQFANLALNPGAIGINYNFAEQPPTGGHVSTGQTASIGFWQNKNGRELILALNGGATSTQLSSWLAQTLPNMYGLSAGTNNLAGKTNIQVWEFYNGLFRRKQQEARALGLGGPVKTDAQIFATALAVYVTNQSLAGSTATSYGFVVSANGVGASSVNVGNSGQAFGVANGSSVSIMDLLRAVNDRTRNGILYDLDSDGDASDSVEVNLRLLTNNVFTTINDAGGR